MATASFPGAARQRARHRPGRLAFAVMCLFGATAPALADCQPASPSSGQTVNCTGDAPTGFQVTNPAVNDLTVIVAPGALVEDNGTFSIKLNNGNTVVNNGIVAGGNFVTGIAAIDGNTITNNSFVTAGFGGVGISVGNNSTVSNAGTGFITGDTFATGILAIGDGNVLTNAGYINVGPGGVAIGMHGNAETVTSSGTITGGIVFTFGIEGNNNNFVTHSGTMILNTSSTGISLGDNNTVLNSGSMKLGAFSTGIGVGDNNNVTVSSTGTITMQDLGGVAIKAVDFNTIVNSGAIKVGDGGGGIVTLVAGIGVGNSNNVTVTGTGTITVGDFAIAIQGVDSNTIVNFGTIKVGVGGTGINVLGSNNAVTNGGTIAVGDHGVGLISVGPPGSQNVLTNNGVITLATATCCSPTTGIFADAGSFVTNNKTITGGDNTEGITAFGSGNIVINNGGIAVGASTLGPGFSVGIDVSVDGGNAVTNNGNISAGAGGIGIATGQNNVITNNGTVVVAGLNAVSIGNCGCFSSDNNTIVNNGTLDGAINLVGSGNSFTNSGLITLTDAGTAVGVTHVIGGDFTQTSTGTLSLRVTSAGGSDALNVSGTATLGGTLRPAAQPGLYGATTSYLGIVTAGNPISTQFAQVPSPSAFLTATAVYHPASVDLTLKRVAFGSVPGETQNQQAVGNALERVLFDQPYRQHGGIFHQPADRAVGRRVRSAFRRRQQRDAKYRVFRRQHVHEHAARSGLAVAQRRSCGHHRPRCRAAGLCRKGAHASGVQGHPHGDDLRSELACLGGRVRWRAVIRRRCRDRLDLRQELSRRCRAWRGLRGQSRSAARRRHRRQRVVILGAGSCNLRHCRWRPCRILRDAALGRGLCDGAGQLQPLRQLDDAHDHGHRADRNRQRIVCERPVRRAAGNWPHLGLRQVRDHAVRGDPGLGVVAARL